MVVPILIVLECFPSGPVNDRRASEKEPWRVYYHPLGAGMVRCGLEEVRDFWVLRAEKEQNLDQDSEGEDANLVNK